MPIKKIIVLLDESVDSLAPVQFAFRYFNRPNNLIIGMVPDSDEAYHSGMEDISQFLARFNLPVIPSRELRDRLADTLIELKSILSSRFTIQAIRNDVPGSFANQCRYADLLILSRNTFDKGLEPFFNGQPPAQFMDDLMCPWIIVPNEPQHISNVVLINDSKEDSLYAIKQFCFIFNRYCRDWDVNLLDIWDPSEQEVHSAEQKMLVSYLKTHCTRLAFHQFKDESPQALRKLLGIDKNTLVITGGGVDLDWLQTYFFGTGVATIPHAI